MLNKHDLRDTIFAFRQISFLIHTITEIEIKRNMLVNSMLEWKMGQIQEIIHIHIHYDQYVKKYFSLKNIEKLFTIELFLSKH